MTTRPCSLCNGTGNERKLRRALGDLIISVRQFDVIIDTLMSQPSTFERGKKIAEAMNGLNMANDSALYHGLGFDFRKDDRRKQTNFADIQKWARRRIPEAALDRVRQRQGGGM